MPEPIRLRVFGDYALFSRPELKVERYSYDVMTPSAARGILDAIYYHPGLRWCVKRIIVERPIRFTNIRRNEVSKKILASDLFAAANGSEKPVFIDRRDAIAQRAATVLRDVSYVIEANFDVITEKMGAEDSADKFYAIFCNRARRVTHFTEDDLELLWNAIVNMFENDHSAARGKMAVRKLIIFKHDSELGNAPSHRTLDLVSVKRRDGIETARSYNDYEATVNEAACPEGVHISCRE